MKYSSLSVFLLLAMLISIIMPRGAFSSAAGESGSELDDFLLRVENNSAGIKSFSCNFSQVRHLAIFPAPVKFTGRLVLSRPDRLRWEFTEPLPSVLVLNGKKGLKCADAGPERQFSLEVDPVMRMVAAQLWAWTSGSYRELQENFNFELLPGPILVFAPKEKVAGTFISKIRVVFDAEFLQPLEVEMLEPGGDRTVISFSGYKRNIELPPVLFTECKSR